MWPGGPRAEFSCGKRRPPDPETVPLTADDLQTVPLTAGVDHAWACAEVATVAATSSRSATCPGATSWRAASGRPVRSTSDRQAADGEGAARMSGGDQSARGVLRGAGR